MEMLSAKGLRKNSGGPLCFLNIGGLESTPGQIFVRSLYALFPSSANEEEKKKVIDEKLKRDI